MSEVRKEKLTCSDCEIVFPNIFLGNDAYDCENCFEVSCDKCASDEYQWICKKCCDKNKPKTTLNACSICYKIFEGENIQLFLCGKCREKFMRQPIERLPESLKEERSDDISKQISEMRQSLFILKIEFSKMKKQIESLKS